MKKTFRPFQMMCRSLLAAAMLWAAHAGAVVLDDDNMVDLVLDDGTTAVRLYGQAGDRGAQTLNYYYMPVNLRLSKRADETPEFLFLKYTSEKSDAQGGLSGGLMHFLMEWGLSPDQEAEVQAKLKKAKGPSAQLMGAAPIEPAAGDAGSFVITSATLSDKTLAPTIVNSGSAPLMPGGKVAAASRLTAPGAQLMAATFEKGRTADLSIGLNFSYQTLTPAAKGWIDIDYSRIQKERDSLTKDYTRTQTGKDTSSGCFLVFCVNSSTPSYTFSYQEVSKQWKFLQEKKIVDFHFEGGSADPERSAKILDAFLQVFLAAMTQPAQDQAPPANDNKDNTDNKGNNDGDRSKQDNSHTDGYSFSVRKFQKAVTRQHQHYDLNVRLPVKHPFNITGNLGTWYDGVRDNPKCVSTVNLNDPFFQHRDINFILDGDAKSIFEDAVNYVTVNVRKNRSSGRPFEDRFTMDSKFIKDKGINATLTYARGEDTNPDAYEYQAQWSLKGGNIWPVNAPWQKGSWEGVTLAAPITVRTIEVEGDLEGMKSSSITRVTVQVHYPRFGQEVEENIQLSPAAGQPLVNKKIFLDRGAKGYAYRLVINHKTEGKLALPWSAQVGDDYIYATIPDNLLADGAVKTAAKEAAKTIVAGATEKVLDRFKGLMGGEQ